MDYMHEYARPFFFEGGEHAVLLTHGFTGTPATVRYLGERLRDAGFTVQGICLPGHGTRLEDMRPVRWQDYLNAELTAVRELKEKYPYVSVCGLSMGGDLTLIAAEQMEVTSCIPISAISCPMLVVQSHGDHTISKDSADIILAGAGARQKEMLWLADAPHACTASKACDEIAGRVIPFLRKAQNA